MQLHAAVTPRTIDRLKTTVAGREMPRLTVEEIADAYAEEWTRCSPRIQSMQPQSSSADAIGRSPAPMRDAAVALLAERIVPGIDPKAPPFYLENGRKIWEWLPALIGRPDGKETPQTRVGNALRQTPG